MDQRIHQIIREEFGGDRNTFIKTLEAQNYTLSEFKKKEMEKIIVAAMRSKNVKTNSIISPAKIDEYYSKHRDEFTSKEQIKLRMIMISGHKDTRARPRKKKSPKKCSASSPVAQSSSRWRRCIPRTARGTTAATGGWIERKTLAEPLEKFAFNMPVGRISNIIDYAGNYYILKVEEKHGGGTKSLAEVRADIEKKLVQEEAQQMQERWIAGLRQKAYIKTF